MHSAVPDPADRPDSADMAMRDQIVHSTDNRALVSSIRQGDVEAFERLFRTHYDSLCAFALSYVHVPADAEDLVTDVLTWVWTHRDTFDPPASVTAYLYAAVRNRALNALRRARYDREFRDTEFESSAIPGMGDLPEAPDRTIETLDDRNLLRRALQSLPAHTRRILALRWGNQMTAREIGVALGISEAAAKMQLSRAMKALQDVHRSLRK